MKTESIARCKVLRFPDLSNACAIASLVFFSGSALAAGVIDATGVRVEVPDRPKRVVTLAPSLGELAADVLGAELSTIVGVSDFTDYPPALKKARSIGPYHRFSMETVVGLRPDLVLATLDGNPKDHVLHLRELGLPVVVVPSGDFDGVERSIRMAAQALGHPKTGETLAERFREGLKRIRDRAAKRTKSGQVSEVFLQIGGDPLVTVGRDAFLHHALTAVGAKNVFGGLAGLYPRPSMEAVLERDPQIILILALGERDGGEFAKMTAEWKRFKNLRAVKSKRVHLLQADSLLRPSMRLLEGLALLERVLYPEVESK